MQCCSFAMRELYLLQSNECKIYYNAAQYSENQMKMGSAMLQQQLCNQRVSFSSCTEDAYLTLRVLVLCTLQNCSDHNCSVNQM